MKRIMFLAFVAILVGCTSQPLPVVVERCPSAMAAFNLTTMIEKSLKPEDLVDSKASIGGNLILETLTSHKVDSNGVHVFYGDSIIIPAKSVGVIENKPVGGSYAQKVTVTFYQEVETSESYAIDFELEPSKYVNINTDKLTQNELDLFIQKGGAIDAFGYLRYAEEYIVYNERGDFSNEPLQGSIPEGYIVKVLKVGDEEMLSRLGNIKVTRSAKNLLMYDGRYIVQNSSTKELFLTATPTTLNQLKYRVCGNSRIIQTEVFDEKNK